MGLAERRAIKTFQDTKLPELQKAIDDAAGTQVELDIDWDSITEPDYAHLYDEAFSKVYFQPLARALEAIAIDDMGKEALASGLKKVRICYSGDSTGVAGFTFEGGVLLLDHSPVSNLDYGQERVDAIVRLLERGL